MTTQSFDCVVIGGGPGGYVAAIKASRLGLKTALVEYDLAGGTCLNRGCIPSKALLAGASVLNTIKNAGNFGIRVSDFSVDFPSMMQRKNSVVSGIRSGLDGLIKSNKIVSFRGKGKLLSSSEVKVLGEEDVILKAQNIILATGSEPRPFPGVPFSKRICSSTDILELQEIPESLLIVGGGVIGCEFASLFNTLGTKVTIVEAADRILAIDNKEISKFVTNAFTKKGIQIVTSASIAGLEETPSSVKAILNNGSSIEHSMALVSIGRLLNTQNLDLDKAGVICEKGAIPTDAHMRTNIPNIFAIGDITAKWMLAHVASHQGIVAAENAAGKNVSMDYSAIPSVIFTSPEVASVGLSLEQAQSQGFSAKSTTFPFRAIGKAVAMMDADGFASIISDVETGQILGAYVVGPHASSLIGEMALAIRNELTLSCIYETVHAHPTLSEIWMEAALLAADDPLHMPPK
ncbi:dihydrolipoyl dehydrogenase [Chlamydiifrater phoenicopteri]|uniref:dihydrolipoyl dehydrogenase n=1 Tax=Chlamydiifrater phoenicopteri TaxID=2681469 RepID=UPI001BCFB250|nr:dihydrolipoyl dehydrogenase [Chlamydiifrater phoenicopteri]